MVSCNKATVREQSFIRAWVDPPPIIRAMPERKRFFSVDPFSYSSSYSGFNKRLFSVQTIKNKKEETMDLDENHVYGGNTLMRLLIQMIIRDNKLLNKICYNDHIHFHSIIEELHSTYHG